MRALPEATSFFGIMLAIYLSDNLSRRKALLIFTTVMLLGVLAIYLSYNLPQALIGLAVYNFTYLGLMRITQVLFTESVDPILRQKFIGSCLAGALVASMLIGVTFQEIGHWRPATLYIGILPMAILLFLIYFLFRILRSFC